MADVKWIKVTTDVFDNRKIRQLEQLPDGDTIIVIWFKLLCLAGVCNDSGLVYFTPDIPYTDQMLATQFNRPLTTVQLALNMFQQYGMIEIVDNFLHVSSWEKYQNVDGLERIREQTRKRVQRYRENQKLLPDNVTCNVTVTQRNGTDIELEKEKDVELDTTPAKAGCCTDVQRVVDKWNSIGLQNIHRVTAGSERERLLKKRIADYGIDAVLEAIDKVKNSSFLTGINDKGWQATFDWFIKPNNFPKVLDGNYADRGGRPGKPGRTPRPFEMTQF